jgi:hypothetical protein
MIDPPRDVPLSLKMGTAELISAAVASSRPFLRVLLCRDSGYQETFYVHYKIGGTLTDVPIQCWQRIRCIIDLSVNLMRKTPDPFYPSLKKLSTLLLTPNRSFRCARDAQ